MCAVALVYATQIAVGEQFENSVKDIITRIGAKHSAECEFGTLLQLIVIDGIDGQFQLVSSLALQEQCRRLAIEVFHQVNDAMARTEAATQNTTYAGIIRANAVDCLPDQFQMIVERREGWLISTAGKRLQDSAL